MLNITTPHFDYPIQFGFSIKTMNILYLEFSNCVYTKCTGRAIARRTCSHQTKCNTLTQTGRQRWNLQNHSDECI